MSRMDTDLPCGWVCLGTQMDTLNEYLLAHGWTRIYRADGGSWTRIERIKRIFFWHTDRKLNEICVGEITDPLHLPLKRGGPVCPPLECPMVSNGLDGRSVFICVHPCAKIYPFIFCGWMNPMVRRKICVHLCNLWETKLIIRVGIIYIRGSMELKKLWDAWRCRIKNISLHNT